LRFFKHLCLIILLLFSFQSFAYADPGVIYELPPGHFLQSGKTGDVITICFPAGTDLANNVSFARTNGFIPDPQWTVRDEVYLDVYSPGTGDPGSYTFYLDRVSAAPSSWLTIGVGGNYLTATAQPAVDGKGTIVVHVQTGPNDDTPVVGREVSIGRFKGEVNGFPVYSKTLSTVTTDSNGDAYFIVDLESNDGASIIAFDTQQLNRAVFSATPYTAPGGFSNTIAVSEFFPTPVGLTVTPATATILEGGTQQYSAFLNYSNGYQLDVTQSANWSVADNTLASVNAGLVTGIQAGQTTISVDFNGFTDTAVLIVNPVVNPVPVNVSVTPNETTVKKGSTQQFIATMGYSDGTSVDVTSQADWSVANAEIASITNSGLATGTGEGETLVSATYKGLTGNANLKVTQSGSSGSSSGGGGSSRRVMKNDDTPPVDNLLENQFIARWPGYAPAGRPAKMPAEKVFTVQAEVKAPEGNYSLRVYYWHDSTEKWVALPSQDNGDGTVEVVNEGGYSGWLAPFWVIQPTFTDVSRDAWYETAINRANGLALIEGYPNQDTPESLLRHVEPDRHITRAEYVSIVTRVLGMVGAGEQKLYDILKPVPDSQVQNVLNEHFIDNAEIPEWCQQHIAAAAESGLVKGIDGKFEPNTPVSRIQAFVIVSNALSKIPGQQQVDTQVFIDNDEIPEWAQDVLLPGLVDGYEDGLLRPNEHVTRAEAIKIIMSLMQKLGW